MAQHLDFGMVLTATDAPGVDAMVEKYCPGNDPAQCPQGASYLWHELMGMSSDCIDKNCNSQLANPLVQVCPAGMRVPTPAEWATLVSQWNGSATVRTAFAWKAVEHKFGSAMSLQGGCAWTSAGGSANATAYCYDLGESGVWASQTFTRHNYGFPVRCIKNWCFGRKGQKYGLRSQWFGQNHRPQGGGGLGLHKAAQGVQVFGLACDELEVVDTGAIVQKQGHLGNGVETCGP
jgi:hypothetical protein